MKMRKELFIRLLSERRFKELKENLMTMNAVDIASLLSQLDDKEIAIVFRLVPKDKAAEVFSNVNSSMQSALVAIFSEKELRELLDNLYMDDTVDMLEELPANLVTRILNVTPQNERNIINQLLNYPDDSAGSIITKYENAFAAIPLLVSFIPMLMDTGGNCGSQSSTLIIRGLALDEVRFSDFFRVVFKEFQISIIVGIVLATANGLRIFIEYHNLGLALVIALSLIVTVTLSKIIGCTLPLFAKKIGLDPALMASPLITTLVDTCSIIVYFNIATTIFKI